MLTAKYSWALAAVSPPATIDEVLVELFRARGIAPEARQRFLTPVYEDVLHDPTVLPDVPRAVERLVRAIRTREEVAIFGDYDADGVTASALLAEVFASLGLRARVVLPHRETDGYGLTTAAVEKLVPPATLLITVDNGTSAHAAVAAARERGADVLIIDHHTVHGDLPAGALVVNPSRPGHAYPFPKLAAVGVAFKLAREVLRAMGRAGEEKWLLDFVALGTLGDRVPLLDENRALVQWGLRVLRERPRVGLAALAAQAGVSLTSCDAHAVTFRLIPRLNAAGRMEHADLAFRLLTTRDPGEAAALALNLEEANAMRKTLTERAMGEIHTRLLHAVPLPDMICVSGAWPVGIVGILAGRIAEDVGRPAAVVSVGEHGCVASVRGNGSVNVVEIVERISTLLTKYGGHAGAAGFSFPRARLPEVLQAFTELSIPAAAKTRPTLSIDAAPPVDLVTPDLARELGTLEPHGEGNERPVFLFTDLRVVDVRPMGAAGDHLRFLLAHPTRQDLPLSAVAFRWGGRAAPARDMVLDIAAEVRLDRFGSRERLDLHVRDCQTHRVPVHAGA